MKRFKVIGVSYKIKDQLKEIKPKGWQHWRFKNKIWVLTLQGKQTTKKFEKELNNFVSKYDLTLEASEWDGSNKSLSHNYR